MAGKFERNAFLFKNTRVYDALFLKDRVPTFFTGCSATILKIIEKKNIPHDQYFYAGYTEKNGYKECSSDYKARRLLIKEDWVHANVPGFGSVASVTPQAPVKPKVYPPAPPLLILHDEENFREDGNVIEIEVRGERRHDAIWFKARHIERMLEMTDIVGYLSTTGSKYEKGKHYSTFLIHLPCNPCEGDKIDKSNTATFLSHAGLMMLLHRRRHPIADKFRAWASEKLFTIRHGTHDQKTDLASELLQITPRVLRATLNTSATAMSALYLFELGSVEQLRQQFSIPDSFLDDHKVYKFGMTEDLSARTQQHENYYGKMPGVNMICIKYSAIDPNHLTAAEGDLKRFFDEQEMRLSHPNFRELAVISNRDLKKSVFREYRDLGDRYAGRLAPLKQEIDKLTEKVALQEKHMAEMEKQRAKIEAIYHQNIELHRELQQKTEKSMEEMKELYKTILIQKEELLEMHRNK